MITESDNAATELMITEVGGKDRVNEWLIRNGFKHTRLQVDKLLFTDFLSIFTGESAMPYSELEDRIGQVSRVIVDHFGGYP